MRTRKLLLLVAAAVCASAQAQTWEHTTAPSFNYPCIHCSADGTKVFTSGFRVSIPIYLSTNRAETWELTSAPLGTWSAIASTPDARKVVAVSYDGLICISEDGGGSWTSNDVPHTGWTSVAISADGARLAAANVAPQTIHLSTDGGTTWKPASNAPSAIWQGIASSADGGRLAAVNSYPGTLCISTNAGVDWFGCSNAPVATWRAVASSADGVSFLAVANSGQIIASRNSGIDWAPHSLPPSDWAQCAMSADGSKLIVVSRSGLIYTSADFGSAWQSNAVPALPWNGVALSADGSKLFAAATGGGVWRLDTSCDPELRVTASMLLVHLSWVLPSIEFILQHNADCSPEGWEDVADSPTLNLSNLHYEISPPMSNNGFYRLRSRSEISSQ